MRCRPTTVCTVLLLASASVCAFPARLAGRWQIDEWNSGVATARSQIVGAGRFTSVLTLEGSRYCKEPVQLSGTITGDTATLESVERVVCGYGGRLFAQVVRRANGEYEGTFRYILHGIPMAEGTFHLTEVVEREPK